MQNLSWMTPPLQIQERKKTLAIVFDYKLTLQYHIENLFKKTSLKLILLPRALSFVELPQNKVLFNAFFQLQFSYWLLVWIYSSRTLNNRINKPHERFLILIFNDKHSTFHELLEEDCSDYINTQNLPFLVMEMRK